MRAVVWHGRRDVQIDTVEDPTIKEPTDAIIRVTSSGLCGSDLHLYEVLAPFMTPGDILGHEPMGIVEAVGADVSNVIVGDRVVVPFNISCGHCFMCEQGLQSQCETTQVREPRVRRRVVRLHEAVWPGARRPSRTAAGAARRLRADQDSGRSARRPLLVPLRRAADCLAVRPVCGRTEGRLVDGPRPRSDRRHGLPCRSTARRRTCHRHRPRSGASGACPSTRRRRPRPSATSTRTPTWLPPSAIGRAVAARTP